MSKHSFRDYSDSEGKEKSDVSVGVVGQMGVLSKEGMGLEMWKKKLSQRELKDKEHKIWGQESSGAEAKYVGMDKQSKSSRTNTERATERNFELEKEIEERIHKRREVSSERDKHLSDSKEACERRLSSKVDRAKVTKNRDDKNREDGDKEVRLKDDKREDSNREHRRKDEKHCEDGESDKRRKYDKYREGSERDYNIV